MDCLLNGWIKSDLVGEDHTMYVVTLYHDVNTEILSMAKKSYTIRLDTSLKEAADRCAEHENRTVTNLIETAVRDYCRERGFLPAADERDTHKRAHSRTKT